MRLGFIANCELGQRPMEPSPSERRICIRGFMSLEPVRRRARLLNQGTWSRAGRAFGVVRKRALL